MMRQTRDEENARADKEMRERIGDYWTELCSFTVNSPREVYAAMRGFSIDKGAYRVEVEYNSRYCGLHHRITEDTNNVRITIADDKYMRCSSSWAPWSTLDRLISAQMDAFRMARDDLQPPRTVDTSPLQEVTP
jgi:hypothetical protein